MSAEKVRCYASLKPTEKHIKEVKKDVKRLKNISQKKIDYEKQL